ncbi:YggS family pyridoxal phosphate-dependent enzyme [Clostridia bacterium]|nr:YggS family pyridoxal phosphate-dependent enzyme [Clostridia bacterium]
MSIKENLQIVQEKVNQAIERSGRDASEITLIGVTKNHPVEPMRELIDLGIRDLGENKAQEIREKYPVLEREANWHFIGHLQKNKVKYIIDKVCMIHAVESLSLAEEISKRALKLDKVMPILLEVNISGEESKYGLTPTDVPEFLEQVEQLAGVKVRGLMTMAPHYKEIEKTRPVFKGLKTLLDELNEKGKELDVLSMGMSNDYAIAIEEGATHIRVGTAILGKRDYSK